MINPPTVMHEHEVRRQAMLQAMQMDVWLPRQQLLNAATSRDYLLEWQPVELIAATPESTDNRPTSPEPSRQPKSAMQSAVVAPAERAESWAEVRDRLALATSGQVAAPSVATPEVVADLVPADVPAESVEPIPRFALQLLRAGNCLVLVDLPTGQPFQSRDPDYQLLKDMLRAAGLTDQPDFMRQGEPIRWPMLHSGNLMHAQHAEAARACVRDLLSLELQQTPAVCVWLLGQHAQRFANTTDETDLYALQPFVEGAQLWALPSLEQVLEQPLLKRDIWRSMCALRPLWQVIDG